MILSVPSKQNLNKSGYPTKLIIYDEQHELGHGSFKQFHDCYGFVTLFDSMAMEDVIGEEATEKFYQTIREHFKDFPEHPCNIHILEGSSIELTQWLEQQLDRCSEKPGGDDSIYDYWPNSVMIAWQIACDIDELRAQQSKANKGRAVCRNKVIKLYKRIAEEVGYEPSELLTLEVK